MMFSDMIWSDMIISYDVICRLYDSKITNEIKRCLLLGRKVMTNVDSILKSRDITLPSNVHLVKAMVFPVVMYGFESWNIKKVECQKFYAFELWCLRRLLRVPLSVRRSNKTILMEISPEYSLEGLMLNLKYLATWCKELTPYKRPWYWERLKARGEGDDSGWDVWMALPTQMDMSLSKLQELVKEQGEA